MTDEALTTLSRQFDTLYADTGRPSIPPEQVLRDTYTGAVTFVSTNTPRSGFVVPADAKLGQTIHAILEVTDNGTPSLTRFARVVVTVVARTGAAAR